MISQKGQAVVEYMILLVVVAAVAIGFYNRLKEMIDQNPDGIFLSPFTALETQNPQQRYKNFRIIR